MAIKKLNFTPKYAVPLILLLAAGIIFTVITLTVKPQNNKKAATSVSKNEKTNSETNTLITSAPTPLKTVNKNLNIPVKSPTSEQRDLSPTKTSLVIRKRLINFCFLNFG